jgi:formylglycine-generating enzyme required for sulfatase activity
MLVMLAQVYAAKAGVLPQNRGDLFAAFVDTLLAREQRRCDPARWPGAEQLRSAMAHLAWSMQEAGERGTAVERAWALARLAEVCEPAQALYLCASASLLDDSGGTVRYVHQLLQEYFVAVALQDRMIDGEDLGRYWPAGWTRPSGWEETFVLLAGMAVDMTSLVRRLLPANPALAARCIGQSGGQQPDEATIRAVQQRLVSLATSVRAPTVERNAAGDALNHVGDPRPGVGLRADGLPDIVWCAVPAGEFIMGNTQQTDDMAYDDEKPQHRPTLTAFEISRYPITNAQFDAFAQDDGYTDRWRRCWTQAGWQWKGERRAPDKYGGVFNSSNHPVVNVTWYEAVAFCNWLGQKLGRPVNLPSEAQWERAARHTDGRRYPWGEQITDDHANYAETGIGTTTAVGIFLQGAALAGTLDMSGNVWEWCLTKWRENYEIPPDDDPEGDITRVLRGGSFLNDARLVRCAVRSGYLPNSRFRDYGFRVVVASP